MIIRNLIDAEGSSLALPGPVSFTADQIHAAHDRVTPIYDGTDGTVSVIEITAKATSNDIIAVLLSCGVAIQALTGEQERDLFGRPQRYTFTEDTVIGEGAYSLNLVKSAEYLSIE